MKRRAFMVSLVTAAALAGCGGETAPPIAQAPITTPPAPPPATSPPPVPTPPVVPPAPTPPPAPPTTTEWVVSIPALAPGQSYTIAIPPGAKVGGTFAISETGTQLPGFITLSSSGVLTISKDVIVDPNAPIAINGVIFAYDQPE